LGPRFDRLSDRQAELLVAVAIAGGTVASAQLSVILGREDRRSYSRTRDELITEGDLFAPRRGELALTVPLLAPYLLAHYEDLRSRSTVKLLPLAEMLNNAALDQLSRGAGGGQLGPGDA
jgi:hypothetical protein